MDAEISLEERRQFVMWNARFKARKWVVNAAIRTGASPQEVVAIAKEIEAYMSAGFTDGRADDNA